MLSICLVWDVVEISWSILGMPIILFLLSPKRPWVRGGGGGWSHHKFMNLNSATCLGDLCMAITSLLKCEVTSKTQK